MKWDTFWTPEFWFGVVVVGIAINLLSAYLKGPIDVFFSRISTAWAARSERAKREQDARIEAFVRDEVEMAIARDRALAMMSTGIMVALLAVLAVTQIHAIQALAPGTAAMDRDTAVKVVVPFSQLVMLLGLERLFSGRSLLREVAIARRWRRDAQQTTKPDV